MKRKFSYDFVRRLDLELSRIKNSKKNIKPQDLNKYGVVLSVQDGVATVKGLEDIGLSEVVLFHSGIRGMVSTLEKQIIKICLLGPDKYVVPGDAVYRAHFFLYVPTGEFLLGRVVNSLGEPIDGGSALVNKNVDTMISEAYKKVLILASQIPSLISLRPWKLLNGKIMKFRHSRKLNPQKVNLINRFDELYEQALEDALEEYKENYDRNMKLAAVFTQPRYQPTQQHAYFRGYIRTLVNKLPVHLREIAADKLDQEFETLALAEGYDVKAEEGLRKTQIERPAPGIMYRQSIHEPLQTGTKVVDALIPIGRGQRELILGDRNTGKTTIAIDAILSQTHYAETHPHDKIACVYVAIGQRQSKVQEVVNILNKHNALQNTCIVFAPAYGTVLSQFIAPYAGTTIAEYFRDNGSHSLVIYDDLTKHAQLHRQLSLLLKTPPGREAFPGDVFYVHARLLERAAKLSKQRGAGSLTALPIVETFDGDSTSYIPTNVISITDGQIYLRQDLFFAGVRPAININFSVSRVGAAAQIQTMQALCSRLKLQMALYNEYKMFARLATDLDPTVKQILVRGDRLLEVFKQKANEPLVVQNQLISFYAAMKGFLDEIAPSSISRFENKLHNYAENQPIWMPYFYMLEDEIDELVANSLITCFMACEFIRA